VRPGQEGRGEDGPPRALQLLELRRPQGGGGGGTGGTPQEGEGVTLWCPPKGWHGDATGLSGIGPRAYHAPIKGHGKTARPGPGICGHFRDL